MKTAPWMLIACVGTVPLAGQDGPAGALRLDERFTVGETLEFEGRLGPLRIGRAQMSVVGIDSVRGVPTMQFQFRILANAAGLFRMNDRFDSWVGLEDFLSRRFVQDFNETRNVTVNRYEIYPDSGYYTRPDVDTALTASADPLDDTAFFYFVRTLDLNPGDSLSFDRYFRPDRNPVIIRVLERDTIEVPAGEFETVVIHPIIEGGMFRQSSDARIWITDDERRWIVQMKIKIAAFTITLRLREVTGIDDAATGPSH